MRKEASGGGMKKRKKKAGEIRGVSYGNQKVYGFGSAFAVAEKKRLLGSNRHGGGD